MAGISTYGRALSQISLINDQTTLFSTLSAQLSTGQKTQENSGLDTDLLTSLRSRTDLKSLETYSNNIDNANIRIELMLTSVNEFKAQAENFLNSLVGTTQESVHQDGEIIYYDDPLTPDIDEAIRVGMSDSGIDIDLTIVKDMAETLYPFMEDLLNAKSGDRYLLSGADTETQPLGDSAILDAAISSLLGDWKDEISPSNISNDELLSALQTRDSAIDTNAITDTIVGYSTGLSADTVGDIYVRVDDNSEIEYTALADDQSFRDIMVALAYFKNDDLYPMADVYADPYTAGDPTLADGAPGATLDEMKDNFYEVYNAITTMVSQAVDDMEKVQFNLENARARLAEIQDSNTSEQNALLTTISDIENVDINEVSVKIQTLQIQLEASYQVTALMAELSLTRYI